MNELSSNGMNELSINVRLHDVLGLNELLINLRPRKLHGLNELSVNFPPNYVRESVKELQRVGYMI